MKISVDTIIDRPQAEVFAAFCDLDNAPDRMSGIMGIERLEGEGFEVGTKWRETRVMFGKEATEDMWVTELAEPSSYHVEAESHGAHYDSNFTFEAVDGGTKVTMTFAGQPLTLMGRIMGAVMGIFFKGATRKAVQQDLDDMKAALEGDVAAS